MTFVVRRPQGRFEIRESTQTASGPRARSLATFRVLDDDALTRAAAAATTPFDRDGVIEAARRVGAPVAESAADDAARALVRELRAGRPLNPALRRLLIAELDARGDADDSIADWVGASASERGAALRDLLELTDRLPRPKRGKLAFPALSRG